MIYMLAIRGENQACLQELSDADVKDILALHFDGEVTGSGKKRYNKVYGTFDIETTSFGDSGLMYIWQTSIDGVCFAGRDWESWIDFTDIVSDIYCKKNVRFIMFVHFLPFEFQFMRNFFAWNKVFAVAPREPVSALCVNGIEYRCSYKLTNMSLSKFTETSRHCIHKKASGEEFNYKIKRYPWTPLTEKELYYCICDVLGLWEALQDLIEDEGGDISKLPLTSTGYVRRDCRDAMLTNPNNKKLIKDLELTEYLYVLLRTARRGGDTHADSTIVGEWLEDVDSWDLQSAYPYVMMTRKFPMSAFNEVSTLTFMEQAGKPLEERTLASVLVISFDNIRIKDIHTRPYIPIAKCTSKDHFVNDNGRIMEAKHISMVITDVDYDIIRDCYDWEFENIEHVFSAEYGMLPKELREVIYQYFYKKTTLKGKDAYLYMKSKNKLNAIFGMMLTDICHSEVVLHNNDAEYPWEEVACDYEKELKRYFSNKNSFLVYQWGVWVTAHCRYLLHEVVRGTNRRFDAYNDTDSHKMYGQYEHGAFYHVNNRVHALADSYDVKPYVDFEGKRYYLGEWEYEGRYDRFKTLGSKKYITVENGKCELTVSGLSKAKGSDYIDRIGHEHFRNGTVFPPYDQDGNVVSGRTAAVYHDVGAVYYDTIDGHTVLRGSSISINDVSYTLGLAGEYLNLLEVVKHYREDTVL